MQKERFMNEFSTALKNFQGAQRQAAEKEKASVKRARASSGFINVRSKVMIRWIKVYFILDLKQLTLATKLSVTNDHGNIPDVIDMLEILTQRCGNGGAAIHNNLGGKPSRPTALPSSSESNSFKTFIIERHYYQL